MEKAFREILNELTAITDPAARDKATATWLDHIPDLQKALTDIRTGAANELKNQGMSLAQIADTLGISRSRAQQLVAGRPRK